MAQVCPEMARCTIYGCNSRYDARKPCQCTADCSAHDSCCEDHEEKCNPSCATYGCGNSSSWQACSCGSGCWKTNNCCADFQELCSDLISCKEYGCGADYAR